MLDYLVSLGFVLCRVASSARSDQ